MTIEQERIIMGPFRYKHIYKIPRYISSQIQQCIWKITYHDQ